MTHSTREVEEVKCRRCGMSLTDCPKTRWTTPLCVVNGVEWDEHVIGLSALHQQLQKARQDWLREEIVRLEGMKIANEHNSECLHNEAPEYCDCDNYIKWNSALQTIIDRYQKELDQDNTTLTQNSNQK